MCIKSALLRSRPSLQLRRQVLSEQLLRPQNIWRCYKDPKSACILLSKTFRTALPVVVPLVPERSLAAPLRSQSFHTPTSNSSNDQTQILWKVVTLVELRRIPSATLPLYGLAGLVAGETPSQTKENNTEGKNPQGELQDDPQTSTSMP